MSNYQFFPEYAKKSLPPIGTNENKKPEDINVRVKFFTPWSYWTWFAVEGEERKDATYGDDFLFFGWVEGHFPELGYFLLSDFLSVTGPGGLKIERDIHWNPRTKLSKVMK